MQALAKLISFYNEAVKGCSGWLGQLRDQYSFYQAHRGRLRYDSLRWLFRIKIVFLDLYPVHYEFSRSVIINTAKQQRLFLVVTTKDHPSLTDPELPANVYIVVMPDVLDELRNMKVDWLITPASDLHPWRIPARTNTVHLFHSLVSMHSAYKEDAFDGYQHFFTCGPHHLREIESLSALRRWGQCYVYDVGYPKVDVLSIEYKRAIEGVPSRGRKVGTVLLAPSWHTSNLLALYGAEMSWRILNMGLSLIIRPHPHTFDVDPKTIAKLQQVANEVPDRCFLENPASSGAGSLLKADVMISDWSGVAYEYAFATERPVLFINTPQKVNSREFMRHKLPAIEDACRDKVGVVVEHPDDIEKGLLRLMQTSQEAWAARISGVRSQYLFNFGRSAELSADYIIRIVTGLTVPRHIVGKQVSSGGEPVAV